MQCEVQTVNSRCCPAHRLLLVPVCLACLLFVTARWSWQAYNNLGVLQRDVGAMVDALAAYDKCLELTPDSRNAGVHELQQQMMASFC